MKTDDLITALAMDRERSGPAVARAMGAALAAGVLVSLAVFLVALGVRSDIGAALLSWRFDVKLAIAAVAVTAALVDCLRWIGPERRNAPALSVVALLLLVVWVGIELAAVPPGEWYSRVVGTNAVVCLVSIPALSLAPLAALLWVMRSGAPASPAWAGAAVGGLAAACGAALYATHCFEDSPLFVAIWYSLAALPVIGLGAFAGSRLLRW